MENFIGVRVADAAEDVRIGERAFERMIFRRERRAKRVEAAIENVDARGIDGGERFFSARNGD